MFYKTILQSVYLDTYNYFVTYTSNVKNFFSILLRNTGFQNNKNTGQHYGSQREGRVEHRCHSLSIFQTEKFEKTGFLFR